MLRRRLKIAWTVFFAVLAVAMCVLWVRSYTWGDRAALRLYGHNFVRVFSTRGQIEFEKRMLPAGEDSYVSSPCLTEIDAILSKDPLISTFAGLIPEPTRPKFGWKTDKHGDTRVSVPHWFAALLVPAIAALPWIHWTNRFSLRAMLIVTTLIAVLLGLVVWKARG